MVGSVQDSAGSSQWDTDTQLASFFCTQGYLKWPAVAPALRTTVLDQLRADLEAGVPPARKDDQGRVHRLDALLDRDPVYRQLLKDETLLRGLRLLLGDNIVVVMNRHNHGTRNGPAAQPPRFHRDVLGWSRNLLAAIVYLEDATVDNGCTRVIPGSHLLPPNRRPNTGGGTMLDQHEMYQAFESQAVPVPMRAGEVLLFDSQLFHTVGLSTTTSTRASICLGLRSADELSESDSDHTMLISGSRIYRGHRDAPADALSDRGAQ